MQKMNRHDLNALMELRKLLLKMQLEEQCEKKERQALKKLERKAR